MGRTLVLLALAVSAAVLARIAYYRRFAPAPELVVPVASPEPAAAPADLATTAKDLTAAEKVNRDLQMRLNAVREAGRRTERMDLPEVSASLAALLKQGGNRELAIQSIKSLQYSQYRLLYSALGISSDQQAKLAGLLADATAKKALAAVELGDQDPIGVYQARATQIDREFQQSVSDLLGAGKAKEVTDAVADPSGTWVRVSAIDLRMRYAGAPMNSDQVQTLKSALAGMTSTYPESTDLAALEAWTRQKQQTYDRLISQARGWLTEAQLSVLSKQLNDDLAVERMGLYRPLPTPNTLE